MLNFFISANRLPLPLVGMKSLYSFLPRANSASNVELSVSTATNQSENLLKKFILRSAGIVALLLFFGGSVRGQVNNYSFAQSAGTYSQVTGTNSTATGDDGTQTAIGIGFTFNFDNVNYTTFSITTNGMVRMGGTGIGTGWTNALGTAAVLRPLIAPFWDDNNRNTGAITYATTGLAPNRVLSVSWHNINVGGIGATSGSAFASYRMNLYETTNVIEFIYGSTMATAGILSASVGINGASTFLSVTPAATSTVSSVTANNAIAATTNLINKKFTFTPPPPPACAAPSTLTSSSITSTSATISWTAASPAPASGYEYFYSTIATAPTAGTTPSGTTAAGVVTANITGLTANTTYYYWVRSNCGGSGTRTWAGSSTFFTGYCQPTGTGANSSITNVVTSGGITNLSNASGFTAGGYADFTAQSCSQSAGATINFTLTYVSEPGTKIFIDWNNDLDFNDAGENVYSSNAYVLSTVSGSFAVPVGQATGNYRMRIVADWNSTVPVACPVGINGETEDYTFNVIAVTACSGTPSPGNTVASSASVATGSTVNLSLSTPPTGSGLTYQWQSGPTNTGAWTNVGTSAATYVPTVSATTWYRCIVTCSGVTGTSAPVQVTVTACIPTMTFGCTDGDVIARVILNTLDNNSGTGCPSGTLGYSNYTSNPALTTTLLPSTSYNCIVYAGQYPANYAAWIDYNDNLIFETTERIGYTLSTVAGSGAVGVLGSSASFPVTLACTPPAGQHLLRIREVYSQTSGITITPCGNNSGYGYGEIEDYTITIAPVPACATPGLVSSVTPSSNSVALTWATSCSSALSYDFQYGPAGFTLGSGTLVSNQTVTISAPNASYTVTGLQAGTNYDIYYRANCGSSTSAWSLTSNFSTPNSVSAASSTPTLCQGTVLTSITHNTQGATGIGTATGLPSGVTAAWSSNIITISGTPAVSGVFSYSIPLTGGFGSVSATGTITVLAAPIAPTATSPQVFCETANATIASLQVSGAAGSTFAWYTAATSGVALSSSTALSIGTTNYFVESIGTNGCVSLTRTSVSVTENPLLSASVSITGTTACPGGVLLFTSTPVNGGTNPTFQWYNNGLVIPNETASTYSASGLLAGDVINVKMIPSGSCVTVCP